MRIHRVEIERFRGIKKLDWTVRGNVVCLVGPGDSRKSTILDAIELALSPVWNVSLDDTDFYDADTTAPFSITVTVGNVPDKLLTDSKYGLETRGWNEATGTLHDEPQDGDSLVLSVRLTVDSSLEPRWSVINERDKEGREIHARDRELFGVARLGDFEHRQLSWSRGSVLSRYTGKIESIPSMLAEAARAARKSLENRPVESLQTAAGRIKSVARIVGVAPTKEYCPGLDIQAATLRSGAMSLHDGSVPLRRAGLGTRRLLTMALQRELTNEGGITLIDEVEHGLEPHHLRRLVQVLGQQGKGKGQIAMTTHSPVVVVELPATALGVVRAVDGVVTVLDVQVELQGLVRKAPDAFLARKVLVCEGSTELGLCRKLDEWWAESAGLKPFAYLGIVPLVPSGGGGSSSPETALSLAELGYEVAFLGDSDRPLSPEQAAMEGAGVRVLLWTDNVSIEQRLCLDLPWDGVLDMVRLAIEDRGEDSVHGAVGCRLKNNATFVLPCDVSSWQDSPILREAIGLAAKGTDNRKGWFKTIESGAKIGEIVTRHLDSIPDSDLAKKIAALRTWVDEDA